MLIYKINQVPMKLVLYLNNQNILYFIEFVFHIHILLYVQHYYFILYILCIVILCYL